MDTWGTAKRRKIFPARTEKQLETERQDFERGYHIDGYTSGGEYRRNEWIPPGQYIEVARELTVPGCDVPLGVLSASEIVRIREVCRNELLEHNSPELFKRMDEAVEFCQLLVKPENHILVSSGQYVEKPVQIATTAEMVNQAVQTLTDLPRFTAAAKTISEENGQQTVWKGQIRTYPLPKPVYGLDAQERIIERTREMCCRPRHEIEQEIAARRSQWRNTGGRGATPSRRPTNRKTPPPSWG